MLGNTWLFLILVVQFWMLRVELEVNTEHSCWPLHHLAISPSEAPHCRQKHLLVQNLELYRQFCFVSLGNTWIGSQKHYSSLLCYPSFVHILVWEVTQQAVQFGNKIGKLPMVQIGIKLESPPA